MTLGKMSSDNNTLMYIKQLATLSTGHFTDSINSEICIFYISAHILFNHLERFSYFFERLKQKSTFEI